MRNAFDMFGASEAVSMQVLAYVLGGKARQVHQEQLEMVQFHYSGKSPDSSDWGIWPDVIKELLRSFLRYYLLRESHDELARATQSVREYE